MSWIGRGVYRDVIQVYEEKDRGRFVSIYANNLPKQLTRFIPQLNSECRYCRMITYETMRNNPIKYWQQHSNK